MTRAEHIEWAKTRALQHLDHDDPTQAWTSWVSDLTKHPATASHQSIELGSMLAFSGHLSTVSQVRDFIEGCK